MEEPLPGVRLAIASANLALFTGFSWRFLFSFGCFLKVFDAGRVLTAWLVHMLATAVGNAFLFCFNIGVKAGFFSGHEILLV